MFSDNEDLCVALLTTKNWNFLSSTFVGITCARNFDLGVVVLLMTHTCSNESLPKTNVQLLDE